MWIIHYFMLRKCEPYTALWWGNVNHTLCYDEEMWIIHYVMMRKCESYMALWWGNVNHALLYDEEMWIIHCFMTKKCESYTALWWGSVNHALLYDEEMWIIHYFMMKKCESYTMLRKIESFTTLCENQVQTCWKARLLTAADWVFVVIYPKAAEGVCGVDGPFTYCARLW